MIKNKFEKFEKLLDITLRGIIKKFILLLIGVLIITAIMPKIILIDTTSDKAVLTGKHINPVHSIVIDYFDVVILIVFFLPCR